MGVDISLDSYSTSYDSSRQIFINMARGLSGSGGCRCVKPGDWTGSIKTGKETV